MFLSFVPPVAATVGGRTSPWSGSQQVAYSTSHVLLAGWPAQAAPCISYAINLIARSMRRTVVL